MESSATTKGFHSTPSNYSSFAVTPHRSPIWYNLHSYTIYQRGRKFTKGLVFHSQVFVFGDSCQRGRKYEPKAKGPHHHRILKIKCLNWYLIVFKKWEKVVSSKLVKTLLNTKRIISLRESFV
jgi:hypothetical protein